jgi:hypothetical protein
MKNFCMEQAGALTWGLLPEVHTSVVFGKIVVIKWQSAPSKTYQLTL